MGRDAVSRGRFSVSSLTSGLALIAIGVWILAGDVTFDALWSVLLAAVGLTLLASGLARRR
jgi:hypothetical protein